METTEKISTNNKETWTNWLLNLLRRKLFHNIWKWGSWDEWNITWKDCDNIRTPNKIIMESNGEHQIRIPDDMPDISERDLELRVKFSNSLNSSWEISELKERAVEAIMSLLNAERWTLYIYDPEKEVLLFDTVTWTEWHKIKDIRLKLGVWLAWDVAKKWKAEIINDVQNDPRFYSEADKKSWIITKNMICIPVYSRNWIFIGLIQAINSTNWMFCNKDLKMWESISWIISIALENLNNIKELEEIVQWVINAFASAIEIKDPYTRWHVERVEVFASIIWRWLWLESKELRELALAAMLHDIGKIWISDSILSKPWKLTSHEFDRMKWHPVNWFNIISKVRKIPKQICEWVLTHHEKYDWSWYPNWLNWDEIPLFWRIIAIADVMDALTTIRPYKEDWETQRAINFLKELSWKHFDPELVEIFIKDWENEFRRLVLKDIIKEIFNESLSWLIFNDLISNYWDVIEEIILEKCWKKNKEWLNISRKSKGKKIKQNFRNNLEIFLQKMFNKISNENIKDKDLRNDKYERTKQLYVYFHLWKYLAEFLDKFYEELEIQLKELITVNNWEISYDKAIIRKLVLNSREYNIIKFREFVKANTHIESLKSFLHNNL